MRIVTDLDSFKKEKSQKLVVALGNFDGVHLGHQEILRTIRERARQIGGSSAVFTFKEHPQRILHKKEDPPILTSLNHKLLLLEQATIDLCFLIDFTIDLSKKSPEDFVRQIFIETLGAQEICLGFNARFGRNRSGDSRLMKQLADQYHFKFLETGPFKVKEQVVSSSVIRELIREGKLEKASELLNRPYSFFGTVIPGSGRGRRLGFPTANLDPHSEAMPPEGVYAAWVRILECQLVPAKSGCQRLEYHVVRDGLKAVLNYGKRPTFEKATQSVPEVHILDYCGELLDKIVEVIVGKRLRSERSFPSQKELQHQIQEDIKLGEKWLKNARI